MIDVRTITELLVRFQSGRDNDTVFFLRNLDNRLSEIFHTQITLSEPHLSFEKIKYLKDHISLEVLDMNRLFEEFYKKNPKHTDRRNLETIQALYNVNHEIGLSKSFIFVEDGRPRVNMDINILSKNLDIIIEDYNTYEGLSTKFEFIR